MKENTCCFFGHRTISETEELRVKLAEAVEGLIVEKKVDTFLFGSRSQFDALALKIVTKLKEKYPHVKRVYVRAEFQEIDDTYEAYLLKSYDKTFYPEKIIGAGRAVYVERNYEMINLSRFCIVYCIENPPLTNRKSGTKLALNYAVKKEKEIILFP